MAIPKLFEAVSILNSDEWSLFGRHLLLYSREESDNYKLYKSLNKNKDRLLEEKFSEYLRTKAFKQMSPKVFSNMLSRVFGWFEDWFAIYSFKSEEYKKELTLNRAYNERGLFKQADKIAKKLELRIKEARHLHINQHKALAELYHDQYYSNNPLSIKNGIELLEECTYNHISSNVEYSLIYLLEIENKHRLNNDYEITYKSILENLINNSCDTKLSKILSIAHLAFKDPQLHNIKYFKEALDSDVIDPSSTLFLVLTIYLRKAVDHLWHNSMNSDVSTNLDAYQLNLKAFSQNKHHKLYAFNLFNAVSVIGFVADYEETDAFIKKWLPEVRTKYKKSTLQFCNALNAFRQENYATIPKLLIDLKFDDPIYKYVCGALSIIAQYELGEESLLETMIVNYKKQLKRNEDSIHKLVRIKLSNLVEIITLLKKSKYSKKVTIDLKKYSPCYYKSWVLKHVEYVPLKE